MGLRAEPGSRQHDKLFHKVQCALLGALNWAISNPPKKACMNPGKIVYRNRMRKPLNFSSLDLNLLLFVDIQIIERFGIRNSSKICLHHSKLSSQYIANLRPFSEFQYEEPQVVGRHEP